MGGRAVSTPVAMVAAAVVATVIAGLAVAIFTQKAQIQQAGFGEEAGRAAREARTRLSLVYHIGSEIMISNDGDIPAKIVKFFIDGHEIAVSKTLGPGEKWSYSDGRLSNARSIAVGLEGGGMIVLKRAG